MAATAKRTLSGRFGVGLFTSDQWLPFQRRVSALVGVLPGKPFVPTAQASVSESALTPKRAFMFKGDFFGFGLLTFDHALPSQRSMSVARAALGDVASPAAQTSEAEMAATPARETVLKFGFFALDQAFPFQCKTSAPQHPAAHAALLETLATPERLEPAAGLVTRLHAFPFQCKISG